MKNYYQIIEEMGLTVFPHQENFLTNSKYDTSEKTVGLFIGTDGGKTTIAAIKLAMFYSDKKNKSKKSVVFAAARKDTRDNMGDTFTNYSRYFKSVTITSVEQLQDSINNDSVQVLIVLPQVVDALIKRKTTKLPIIDGWMIFDEAHEWYLKPTVQRIIGIMSPKYKMVMTGTPFDFNRKRNYENYYVSVEELQDMGKSGDADVITVASAYNFRNEDYLEAANGFELRANAKINSEYTIKSLELVIKQMLKSLKCRFNSNATLPQLVSIINKIDPTIIYARNREMGNQILNAMITLGLNVAYSDSDVDPDSQIIRDFKNGKYQFVIVVDRIKQGFSYNELFNIVDMSLTTKPSVIMQMYGRLLRKSKLQPNKTKRYFKVAPKNEIGYVEALMLGVLNLCTKEYYSKFDNNSGHLPIPRVTRRRKTRRTCIARTTTRKTRTPRVDVLQSFADLGMDLNMQNFKSIKHNENKYFEITRVFKMSEIRAILKGRTRFNWTYDLVKEQALKFNSKYEWEKGCKKSYQWATSRRLIDELTTHMVPKKTMWTDETAIAYAKEWKDKGYNRSAFEKAGNWGCLGYLRKHGLLTKVWEKKAQTGPKNFILSK